MNHLAQRIASPALVCTLTGVLFCLGAHEPRPAQAQEIVAGPVLTQNFDTVENGLPAGWVDESAGELIVRSSAEGKKPKEGRACWRIQVPAWRSGAAQFHRHGIPLHAGKPYYLEIWLRGAGLSAPATLRLGKGEKTYQADEFFVGTEWRRCVLKGTAPVDDPDASLTLNFTGSGDLYVDALSLRDEAPPEPEAKPEVTPVKGNRIYNSSFELGTAGWAGGEGITTVAGASPNGARFARLKSGALPLQCRPFVARPEAPYTVSAYLHSERPGAQIRAEIKEIGGLTTAAETFSASSEWKRISLKAALPCRHFNRYYVSFRAVNPADSLDLDAVQVEEGSLTEYQPAAPFEVSLPQDRKSLFPQPHQNLSVPVQVAAREPLPEGAAVQLRVEDLWGGTVGIDDASLKMGETRATAMLNLRPLTLGTLRFVLLGTINQKVVSRDEKIVTVLPPAAGTPDPASFFGGGQSGAETDEFAAIIGARAGMRWWRLPAQPGNAPWPEREVSSLRSHGLSLLGVADADSASSSEFAQQVRKLVTRFREQLKALEITRFADANGKRPASPETLAAGALASHEAAKELPVVGTVSGGVESPNALAGLLKSIEALGVHAEGSPEAVTLPSSTLFKYLRPYRAAIVAGGGRQPYWLTRSTIACPSYYSWAASEERAQAASIALAKLLILARTAEVERFFYGNVWQVNGIDRTFDALRTEDSSLLDYDGAGKPTLAAFAACAQNLDGAAPAGSVELPHLRAYLFRQGKDTLVALWSPTALTAPINVELKLDPHKISAHDLMGNLLGGKETADTVSFPLRDEPIYLRLAGADLASIAAQLKKVPATQSSPKKK